MRRIWTFLLAGMPIGASLAAADVIGKVGTDWTGNDIVIEAINDPNVEGVTCYVSYFSRSIIDRLSQGNWFEDPSNSAISCRQTGPIRIGDIETDEDGEEIFTGIEEQRISGFREIQMLRQDLGDEVEFVTEMWFDSLDAVREFSGEDYEVSVVPPAARAVLSRFDERSQHYEVRERR